MLFAAIVRLGLHQFIFVRFGRHSRHLRVAIEVEDLRSIILFVIWSSRGKWQLNQLLIVLVRVVSLHYMHAHVVAVLSRQLRVERFYEFAALIARATFTGRFPEARVFAFVRRESNNSNIECQEEAK